MVYDGQQEIYPEAINSVGRSLHGKLGSSVLNGIEFVAQLALSKCMVVSAMLELMPTRLEMMEIGPILMCMMHFKLRRSPMVATSFGRQPS